MPTKPRRTRSAPTPKRTTRASAQPTAWERNEELAIARTIQAAMIPRSLPRTEGLDMATLYLPCGLVGGDLFDVVQISEDVLGFLIFDVSGHGVASALIASMAKVSFLTHMRSVLSPRAVLERVNEEMAHNVAGSYFVTAFIAYLDLHSNKLTYCNASHTPPVVYQRSGGELVSLQSSGLGVGIFSEAFYEERSIFLNPGDWILLFSNGLYGIYDPVNERTGRAAFEKAVLGSIGTCTPQQLLSVFEKRHSSVVSRLSGGDDIGAVAVEILTQSRRNQIKEKLGFTAPEPVYLQFISYFEEMDRATAVVLREMDEYGYPDDTIRRMKISLTELLANAIYHGNGKDHGKKITIGHVIRKDVVVVSIMDEGPGFDPATIPDPTLPENLEKDRGRGLFIVRNYVDKMEFNEKGNGVTITKYHKSET
jgi:sigma-B regulation protein RsbU (phosphoserine phosphatase)